MSLDYSSDTNLSRQIKQIVSRATNANSNMTSDQKALLYLSAMSAAGNIQHEGLKLSTIKWVGARSAKISASPLEKPDNGGA